MFQETVNLHFSGSVPTRFTTTQLNTLSRIQYFGTGQTNEYPDCSGLNLVLALTGHSEKSECFDYKGQYVASFRSYLHHPVVWGVALSPINTINSILSHPSLPSPVGQQSSFFQLHVN